MTKAQAIAKFKAAISSAIHDAEWDGLTQEEIAAILKGESVR